MLQRLATLAKSKGDLIRCVVYYKRILKIPPEDTFAATQIRQILHTQERDAVLSPTEVKWARWQDFYEQTTSHVAALELCTGKFYIASNRSCDWPGDCSLYSLRLIPGEKIAKRLLWFSKMNSLSLVTNQKRNALRTGFRSIQSWGCKQSHRNAF